MDLSLLVEPENPHALREHLSAAVVLGEPPTHTLVRAAIRPAAPHPAILFLFFC